MNRDDWKRAASRVLTIGNELATLAVHVKDASPMNIAALGLRTLHTYVNAQPTVERAMMGVPRLRELYFVTDDLRRLCRTHCRLIRRIECDGERMLEEYDVHDVPIVFEKNDSNCEEGPWIRPPFTPEHGQIALARLVWEVTGRSMTIEPSRDWDPHVKLLPDDLAKKTSHDSAIATQIHEWCRPFIAKGTPRAILFYGQPGSGKSTAMRRVAEMMGGFSVRLDCRRIMRLGDANLGALLGLLKPNTVLLDDLDRGTTSEILSAIDLVRETTQLLLASVNDVTKLDPALPRVGRFDKLVEVEQMDAAAFDQLVGDVPQAVRDRLAVLPAAYVSEFSARARVLGIDVAIADVEELARRASEIEERMTAGKPATTSGPATI